MTRAKYKPESQPSGFNLAPEAYDMINGSRGYQKHLDRVTKFNIPDSPKIVGDKLTQDSLPINNYDFKRLNMINTKLLNTPFMGYPEYALLSQSGIIRNIIEAIASDSVKNWITFSSKSAMGGEINISSRNAFEKKVGIIQDAFERLDVQTIMGHAMETTCIFGGCKVYPKIDGDDSTEGGLESETPLFLDKVEKGSLQYLQLIEPLYATPINENSSKPLLQSFYVPETWKILDTTINTSRLCHFTYNNVPTYLKPIYWFNGQPLIQLILDYVFGMEAVRQNVVGITGRYNINIFKTNMTALIRSKSGVEGAKVLDRIKLANEMVNNFGVFAMDNNKETPEEWQQFTMSLSGLPEILDINSGLVCSVAGVPEIRIFGTAKGGMGNNRESELKLYYDVTLMRARKILRRNIKFILDLVQMSEIGSIDSDLTFTFNPLWTPTPLEQAQIQKTKADMNAVYVNCSVLGQNEVRSYLNKDPESGYNNLEEITEPLDEETDALEKEVAGSDAKK